MSEGLGTLVHGQRGSHVDGSFGRIKVAIDALVRGLLIGEREAAVNSEASETIQEGSSSIARQSVCYLREIVALRLRNVEHRHYSERQSGLIGFVGSLFVPFA